MINSRRLLHKPQAGEVSDGHFHAPPVISIGSRCCARDVGEVEQASSRIKKREKNELKNS